MAKHFGKCSLCGRMCELSFEHIPPRAAFNSNPAKPITGDKILGDNERMPWETAGLSYDNQQKGMGKYSICEDCNNKTGSWYGNDYAKLAHCVHEIISQPIDENVTGIGIKRIYPLRIIKQVLSMFCSINAFDDQRTEILKEFVLDRDSSCLDTTRYKLCMYFNKSRFMKYVPLSAVLRLGKSGWESMAISEITAYPLGFVLYFDPTQAWEYDGFDITHFSDYKYDDSATVEMPLCIKEVNALFPIDYRTKEEIKECVEDSMKWAQEHGV